jgi:hypothetical protein
MYYVTKTASCKNILKGLLARFEVEEQLMGAGVTKVTFDTRAQSLQQLRNN